MHEYNQPSPQANENGFVLYNPLGEWTPALHVHLMVYLTQLRNAIALSPRTWGCQWSQKYIGGKPHRSNHLHRRSGNRFANTAWQRNEIMEGSTVAAALEQQRQVRMQSSRSRSPHSCATCWVRHMYEGRNGNPNSGSTMVLMYWWFKIKVWIRVC